MPFPSRPGTYACVWASALLEVQVGVVLPDRTPHRSTEHLGIEPESDGTVLITHVTRSRRRWSEPGEVSRALRVAVRFDHGCTPWRPAPAWMQ